MSTMNRKQPVTAMLDKEPDSDVSVIEVNIANIGLGFNSNIVHE